MSARQAVEKLSLPIACVELDGCKSLIFWSNRLA